MSFIEKTAIGWFARLGASFSGMGVGLVLFIIGTALLWWNEGDFVETNASLLEARSLTQELGDNTRLDPSFNGKIIHSSGFADTQDILVDPVFKISTRAVALTRSVEFYQWTEQSRSETKEKLGGGKETITTYSYVKKWVKRPVDSSKFKDSNVSSYNAQGVLLSLDEYEARAVNVTLGTYRLPSFFINSISGTVPLSAELSKETLEELTRQIVLAKSQNPHADQVAPLPPETSKATPNLTPVEYVHAHGNTIYVGVSPAVPQIGDVRVTFREVRPAHISIIAKVNGDTFERFHASNGKTVSKLSMGTLSMENMFGDAHSGNSFATWILRFLGIGLVVTGLGMFFAPISIIAAFIPLLGTIVSAGVGIVCLLLGLAWSLVIISIAWLRFRPLEGTIMLLVAGGLTAFLIFRGRKKKAEQPSHV